MEYTIQRLLVLRKLTRAVADLQRGHLKECMAALTPLLRPRSVLGEHIQGSREAVPGQEKALLELQNGYKALSNTKMFNIPRELKTPLELLSATPELSPTVYTYEIKTETETKLIKITSPLKWVLNYTGFAPQRLQELIAGQAGAVGDELQQCVLHQLVMQITASKQPGLIALMGALRYPLSIGRLPETGELPVTFVTSAISTVRPPDPVIIESTEISGMPAFEEIVNIDDIVQLHDPLKDRLIELVKTHDKDLLPS
jgi:hypothetical protein